MPIAQIPCPVCGGLLNFQPGSGVGFGTLKTCAVYVCSTCKRVEQRCPDCGAAATPDNGKASSARWSCTNGGCGWKGLA